MSEPELIASTFNSYFKDIPATLRNNISNNAITFESYLNDQIPESENFIQTSTAEITKVIIHEKIATVRAGTIFQLT